MKRTIILIATVTLIAACLSGCASLVLPYEEEPLCKREIEGGYCGSLSEVYDAISYQQYPKKIPTTNKAKGGYLQ